MTRFRTEISRILPRSIPIGQEAGGILDPTERLDPKPENLSDGQCQRAAMGDRVAALKGGKLMLVDTPANLYDRPANEFVAGFIGSRP